MLSIISVIIYLFFLLLPKQYYFEVLLLFFEYQLQILYSSLLWNLVIKPLNLTMKHKLTGEIAHNETQFPKSCNLIFFSCFSSSMNKVWKMIIFTPPLIRSSKKFTIETHKHVLLGQVSECLDYFKSSKQREGRKCDVAIREYQLVSLVIEEVCPF